jgi:hypothetical protein
MTPCCSFVGGYQHFRELCTWKQYIPIKCLYWAATWCHKSKRSQCEFSCQENLKSYKNNSENTIKEGIRGNKETYFDSIFCPPLFYIGMEELSTISLVS